MRLSTLQTDALFIFNTDNKVRKQWKTSTNWFRLFLILGIIILPHFLLAQQKSVFKGKVLDDETGESLIGATIRIYKNATLGTTADIDGNFYLELKPGTYKFITSYTGKTTDTLTETFSDGQTIEKVIKLKTYASSLAGVEIVVGKFDQKIEKLTVSMEVMQLKQIESKNATSIEAILDNTPGLNILDGEPQIRGGSGFTFGVGSKVGVFIDDMPILSGDANRPYWDFIPMENIRQIEVVKGASSVLSGSSSLSGAIYFRTASPEIKPMTKVRVYGGFYSNPKESYMKWWEKPPLISGINVLHSRIVKNTDIVIGMNAKYDHGYEGPPVTLPMVVDTVTNFTESQMAERNIGLNFNIRHRSKKYEGLNYGINGNLLYEKTKMMLAWLDDSSGFYRAYPGAVILQDHYIFYLDPFINYFSQPGVKHTFKARVMNNNNQMSNGQSIRNTLIYTDYNFRKNYPQLKDLQFIGGFSTQYTMSHADMYASSGSPDNTLLNVSGYTEIQKSFYEMLNISAGLRIDYNDMNSYGGDLKTIFRAGASLKLLQETYLRMSVGQGYRYPTIAERFVRLSLGTFGVFENPALVPETSLNSEIGIKQGFKFLNYFGYLDIAVFQQEYKNTIEYLFGFWDPTYTYAIAGFKFLNTGKSKIIGSDISLAGKSKLGKNVVLSTIFGYNYIMPKSLEPDYVFANDYNPSGNTDFTYRSTSVDPSREILKYRFLHTLKADVELEYHGFAPAVSFKYFSKIENLDKAIQEFENATVASGGSLQPIQYMDYFNNHNNGNLVIDLRLSYSIHDKHKISVTANNLTNRWYSLRPLKAEAMRSIMFQYSLKI
jgi:iron complex outermembrane receptor protein